MENTPYLSDTLLGVLGQHAKWFDLRHRPTLAWMMVGLRGAKTVSLGAWAPSVVGRAQEAQRLVRRLRRWLDHNRRKAQPLSGPLIEHAVVRGMGKRVSVALDTSRLWKTSGLIRLSLSSRGRAVPLGWRVSEHGSAAVALETYKALLEEGQSHLPWACKAVLLADRGGAATPWMSHLRQLGWHFRLRIKAKFWMHPSHLASFQGGEIALQPGPRCCWQGVSMTDKHFGLVPLAVARPLGSEEYW